MPVYTVNDDPNLHIGTAFWLKYIRGRVENNKDFICPIVGKTGSGKSYSALSMMKLLNGKINKDNYFFKASDFLKRACDPDTTPGTVLIWDEIGVGLNAKQWQSKINTTMRPVFQTIRHNNLIILFTLPFFSFLDSDLRKLVHGVFETKRIDFNTKETVLKPVVTQTNQDTGKQYKKFLKVNPNGEGIAPVKRIYLPIADKESIAEYEKTAAIFKTDVKQQALKILLAMEAKETGNLTIELTPEDKIIVKLFKEYRNRHKVAEILGCGLTKVGNSLTKARETLGMTFLDEIVSLPR